MKRVSVARTLGLSDLSLGRQASHRGSRSKIVGLKFFPSLGRREAGLLHLRRALPSCHGRSTRSLFERRRAHGLMTFELGSDNITE